MTDLEKAIEITLKGDSFKMKMTNMSYLQAVLVMESAIEDLRRKAWDHLKLGEGGPE